MVNIRLSSQGQLLCMHGHVDGLISFARVADGRITDIFYTPTDSSEKQSVVAICYTVNKEIVFVFSGQARRMVNLTIE